MEQPAHNNARQSVIPILRPYLDTTYDRVWEEDLKRTQRPVFIIGIHRRSGTNYLADALQLTSQLALPLPIAEDYLLQYSHLIMQYAKQTAEEQYAKRFQDDQRSYHNCVHMLLHALGDGLISFLRSYVAEGKRLLTKTPDPWNLENFFYLFPQALVIIIIRDGRDCVESSKWAFPGRSYLYWITTWAINARTIVKFIGRLPIEHMGQVIVTRYEDLVRDTSEMERVLRFVGCSVRDYPWETFRNLPVRGSTFFRGAKKELHWQPVDKTPDFQPIGRWAHWSWWLRWQFRRVAGRELAAFGYQW